MKQRSKHSVVAFTLLIGDREDASAETNVCSINIVRVKKLGESYVNSEAIIKLQLTSFPSLSTPSRCSRNLSSRVTLCLINLCVTRRRCKHLGSEKDHLLTLVEMQSNLLSVCHQGLV